MANIASELVVAASGSIAVAPVGTTLPVTPTAALATGWTDLGYATEDGVTLTGTPTIESFMAWQTRQPVRRELTAQDLQVSFTLEQWNKDTVPLAFGGGVVTTLSAGVFKYAFLDEEDALDERALVITWNDGGKNYRAVFERGNVTDAVETNLVRSALALLPITFAVSAAPGGSPGYLLTDDPALDPA